MSGSAGTRHKILFAELYVDENDGGIFEVGPAFFEVLKRQPETRRTATGNAYVFGRAFPRREYQWFGKHWNDGAQTGLLEVSGLSPAALKKLREDSAWHEIYRPFGYDWDDRQALDEARTWLSERILFVGRTVGGDVGANLYLHRNAQGEVDGAIIENNCFFRTSPEAD